VSPEKFFFTDDYDIWLYDHPANNLTAFLPASIRAYNSFTGVFLDNINQQLYFGARPFSSDNFEVIIGKLVRDSDGNPIDLANVTAIITGGLDEVYNIVAQDCSDDVCTWNPSNRKPIVLGVALTFTFGSLFIPLWCCFAYCVTKHCCP